MYFQVVLTGSSVEVGINFKILNYGVKAVTVFVTRNLETGSM